MEPANLLQAHPMSSDTIVGILLALLGVAACLGVYFIIKRITPARPADENESEED